MAVKPLRRLSADAGPDLSARMRRMPLHDVPGSFVSPIGRDRSLVIEREGNLLCATGRREVALAYGFVNDGAFIAHFPTMLEALLARLGRAGNSTVRFRLQHGSSRPAVEPVLRNLAFTPKRPWLRFALDLPRRGARVPAHKGVRLRDGGISDLDDVVRLDREAFPDEPMPRDAVRAMIEDGGERVLLAEAAGRPVGAAVYMRREPDVGYLRSLMVEGARRGEGIGTALVHAVAARLAAEGATRLDLRTEEDNFGAIRLYRRLGFRHVGSGRDYERPVSAAAVAAQRRASEGTFVKFGGWR